MISHVAAAALLLVQAQAAAETPRCLTREQAQVVATAAIPIAVEALVQRCRPHVGPTAFLNTGANQMLLRMRAAGEPRQAEAMAALGEFSGGNVPPNVTPQMLAGMLTGMLGANLRPEACSDVNNFVEAIAPLPAENWGRMAGALLGISGTSMPEGSNSPLCPA